MIFWGYRETSRRLGGELVTPFFVTFITRKRFSDT